MTKAEFDAEIARLKASFTALLAKREPEPRKSLAGPRGRKLRALCNAARAQALIDDPSESDIVRLRYAEGERWPSWSHDIENMNVSAIEAVLDALGGGEVSTHQHIYVGPYLHFAAPGKGGELGDDESLRFVFPMGHVTGNVWIPNGGFERSLWIDSSVGDMESELDDRSVDRAKLAFRARFAKQRSILKKAFGSGGTVRYGVVVWWG